MALVFTSDLSKASTAQKYPKFIFNQRLLKLKHFSVNLRLNFTFINNDLLN